MARNLQELLTTLRSEAFESNSQCFQKLSELLGPNVRFTCEIVRKSDNPSEERFGYLNGAVIERVLLSALKHKIRAGDILAKECSGVVLTYPSWDVVSFPAPITVNRFDVNNVIKNINSYSAYEINDGTVVTLYHYGSEWRLSSTNGFDVTDYKWMGQLTYMEALIQLLDKYPNFSFDNLDKNRSYTIGFRHHEFHPLEIDSEKVWFIDSADLNTLERFAAGPELGLDLQKSVEIPTNRLKNWLLGGDTDSLVRIMRTRTKESVYYGVVLRSNNVNCQDVIIESELMKTIRGLLYNFPKANKNVEVNNTNRLKYVILRAYLTPGARYKMHNIFPQFRAEFVKFDGVFAELTRQIIHLLRARMTNTSAPQDPRGKLAMTLARHIYSNTRLNTNDPQCYDIITDFIKNKDYLDIYFTYFN